MTEITIKLKRKNTNYEQKLTFEEFKNEFRPEIKEATEIYCGREKISEFNFDELLTKDLEEIQKFLNRFRVYFNKYIDCNWIFVGAIAYDKFLYGIKVYDYSKKTIAIILKTWFNTFSSESGPVYVKMATCVDYNGKNYNTDFENLVPYDELDNEELEELGI